MSDPIRDASLIVVRTLVIPEQDDGDGPTSLAHLRWMRAQVIAQSPTMPIDKMSRWIGFIQGVLVSKGHLDVDEERDRTRPIFHHAYAAAGLKLPETIERSEATASREA